MNRERESGVSGAREHQVGAAEGDDIQAGERVVSLNAVRYDKNTGLVPVVTQDIETGQVLMTAYANREALKRTYGTGQAWFWSRSRQSYWRKGETSGNVLHVREVRIDCDGDTVLYLVNAAGPACHTGNTSCFYRDMIYQGKGPGYRSEFAGDDTGIIMEEADMIEDVGCFEDQRSSGTDEPVRLESNLGQLQPETANTLETSHSELVDLSVLQQLWKVLEERFEKRPQGSYTTFLFEHGMDKIAKKVGEEATEVVIAAKNVETSSEVKEELEEESADLLYHLLVLWKQAGISPDDVFRVLQGRTK